MSKKRLVWADPYEVARTAIDQIIEAVMARETEARDEGETEGYDNGRRDVWEEVADNLVIRWSDEHIYTWYPVLQEWRHTPQAWGEELNRDGE